ncbi:hypothetical protein NLJ89_g9729 [Agrocybe chaxingu]|uniref:Uncharacterized protein n=1 Tax=Agrocybe chaxingu TaxID=84603 RepID=A0A9W8MST7_9AGAR|nr:hypothetical protein NLJ89_g9729 [Agrocybe chaxingu]
MLSKISNFLKPHHATKEEPSPTGEVLLKVQEQHPNMSVFHNPTESGVMQHQGAEPSSPSVHSKKSMFRRLSRPALKDDLETQRAGSPFQLPPKKVRNPLDEGFNANGSQVSLAESSQAARLPKPILKEESQRSPSPFFPPGPSRKGKNSSEDETNLNGSQVSPSVGSKPSVVRRSSFDMLRPSPPRQSQNTTRSVRDTHRRPSLDLLREDSAQSQSSVGLSDLPANPNLLSTPAPPNINSGSVRSILRDRNTPGTGQNVRFFSKEAFKIITPDQSLSSELQNKPQPPLPPDEIPYYERVSQMNSSGSGSPTSLSRISRPRPKLDEIFSPLSNKENAAPPEDSDMSLSLSDPAAPAAPIPDYSNLFDVSQQLDIPPFPPGLGFDVNAPIFDSSSFDTSANDISYVVRDENSMEQGNRMTSTPAKGKGKERAVEEHLVEESVEVPAPSPAVIDETIFHAKEKGAKLPSPLHERSQSFSFGQTVFYSMANSTGEKSAQDSEAAYPSSDLKPDSTTSSADRPTPPSAKGRSRALSDTVFQTMLRSSSKPTRPEADINDESSSGLVVYSAGAAEPDPFSANANTYYTPQTMIPTTPPKGLPTHHRKTSKEENLIISLQTQLQLQSDLCAQYEADLKARDELVDMLSKKLADVEKDESKRKNALRAWKKKVQELERACRQLEEAVDHSRQESMERSVMDEASSEALRMLHRQIAALEREKGDWLRKEDALQAEVTHLEGLIKEKSEEVTNLKETLWSRDECERQLNEGIREAKEQIDMMGNISIGIDEEELRRLMMEKDQKELRGDAAVPPCGARGAAGARRAQGTAEQVNGMLKTKEEEFATLKAELEAQWEHTEKAERDALKADVQEYEVRTSNMEVEWNESENKRNELDAELQEVWNMKDELEKERGELEDALQREQRTVEQLTRDVQHHENRISELEQEQQFANENIVRLEENLNNRNEEIVQLNQSLSQKTAEVEELQDQMSTLRREHTRLVNEQARTLQDAAGQQDQTTARMEDLIRAKAEVDVELKTSKDRLTVLREEVERLRRQIHVFQQESADKDLKIVQMTKQHSQDKEDLQGLNIALDSKQQELELVSFIVLFLS